MRARIAAAIIALAALLASWLALASMAFLWVLGFWQIYPWPAKLWMWIRYAVEAPPNAIVHRWLIISAIVASLPFLTIGALMRAALVVVAGQPAASGPSARRRSAPDRGRRHSQLWQRPHSYREGMPGPATPALRAS